MIRSSSSPSTRSVVSRLSRLLSGTVLLSLIVLSVIGPACRARSSTEPGTIRLIDLLTDSGVVDSPLINAPTVEDPLFPDKSA